MIRRWLLAKWLSRGGHGTTKLKGLIDLTGHVFSERRTTFSGLAGPPRRSDADLLIQKGLLARWRWRGGERLLNLKDLLPVLPPSLKRVFENGPILRPLFWCRIVPNSAIFCQNAAEYGIKSTFFATDFMRTGQVLRLGRPSQGAPNTNWPEAESITRAPHLFAGRAVTGSHERVAGWLPIWSN